VRESKIRKLGKLEAYPTSVLASISAGSGGDRKAYERFAAGSLAGSMRLDRSAFVT